MEEIKVMLLSLKLVKGLGSSPPATHHLSFLPTVRMPLRTLKRPQETVLHILKITLTSKKAKMTMLEQEGEITNIDL